MVSDGESSLQEVVKWTLSLQKVSGEDPSALEVSSSSTLEQLKDLVRKSEALPEEFAMSFCLGDRLLEESPNATLAEYGIENGSALTMVTKKGDIVISGASGGAEGCNTRWYEVGTHNGRPMYQTSKEESISSKPNRIVWEDGFTDRWPYDGFAYDWEAPRKQAKWTIVCDDHHRYSNAADTEVPPSTGWSCRVMHGVRASGTITLRRD
eukprot:TRINITY_DN75694_c0_g1_i1.p1 TRINITY_DN75694_c0_g1~~TRINITY_DN75694_c0_g1_i1.p1  ORF type:complete len:226 (+),score=25.26 TRINITY_DN75694_c0_g1_i1:54-680(+)